MVQNAPRDIVKKMNDKARWSKGKSRKGLREWQGVAEGQPGLPTDPPSTLPPAPDAPSAHTD